MTPLLRTSSLRYLRRHPWQIGLAVLGVALGVAVSVGVDLANASAHRAFDLSTEAVTGRATHQIVGGPDGLDDGVLATLRAGPEAPPMAPVVEGWVSVPAAPGRLFRLLGVDPFSEAPFRSFADGHSIRGLGLAPFLVEPGSALLSAETIRLLQLDDSERLLIEVEGRAAELRVVGRFTTAESSQSSATEDLLVVDIGTAQEILDRLGRVDRIDVLLTEPFEAAEEALRRELPSQAVLVESAARAAGTREMTRAFRLNLQALSLLALICGAFLIYNTMTFSVVQRRELIGMQRALGVTRREVFGYVLAEAALIGALGATLGCLLGVGLAQALIALVARTLNDLYFVVQVTGVDLQPLWLLKGFALGCLAAVAAAIPPAREATRAAPRATLTRSTLEEGWRQRVVRGIAAGFLLLAAAGLLLALPGRSLVLSFAGLFAGLLGCACLTPGATVGLSGVLRRPLGALFGVLGRMAAAGVVAALSRTAVAIASLMVAVAVTVGIATMVGSFRSTVVSWLDQVLGADVYLTLPGSPGSPPRGQLDDALVAELRALPGVEAVDTLRWLEVDGPGGASILRVIESDYEDLRTVELAAGEPREAFAAFRDAGAALITEPYAYRRGLAVGDRVELRTAEGIRAFPVAGVYYDYGSERGAIALHRSTYERHWEPSAPTAVALYALPEADVRALAGAAQRRVDEAGQAVTLTTNRELREGSLEIFDRTFQITRVLRWLAGAVAFIGVLSALMALQLERAREIAVLRANGLTPRQVFGWIVGQTGIIGLAAGLLSIPVGLALSAVMIFVINRRSFGWSMEMVVASGPLLQALVLALSAALLAGLYPAYRLSRGSTAEALREE